MPDLREVPARRYVRVGDLGGHIAVVVVVAGDYMPAPVSLCSKIIYISSVLADKPFNLRIWKTNYI